MFLTTNRQSPSSDCSTSALPKARQLLVPSFALGFKSKLSVWALAKMVITVIQSSSRVNLVTCFNIILAYLLSVSDLSPPHTRLPPLGSSADNPISPPCRQSYDNSHSDKKPYP